MATFIFPEAASQSVQCTNFTTFTGILCLHSGEWKQALLSRTPLHSPPAAQSTRPCLPHRPPMAVLRNAHGHRPSRRPCTTVIAKTTLAAHSSSVTTPYSHTPGPVRNCNWSRRKTEIPPRARHSLSPTVPYGTVDAQHQQHQQQPSFFLATTRPLKYAPSAVSQKVKSWLSALQGPQDQVRRGPSEMRKLLKARRALRL